MRYGDRSATVERRWQRKPKRDISSNVRKAPVERVTDQNVLADIAKNAVSPEDGIAAVARVTDQNLLTDIAKNAKDPDVRMAALAPVTDKDLLANIAKNTKDWVVRKVVMYRLGPPGRSSGGAAV